MDTLQIYQHYWWFLISLLASLLVVFMFVQGGQTIILRVGKNELEKKMILNSLGRKWEITFTTLVVFGGAFFASFSLFYSTSFSGAYWLWMIILFSFIVQAVAYEYMNKPGNFLGRTIYTLFLYINGFIGVFSIGVVVGTFFTGSAFIIDKNNITNYLMPVISKWESNGHGLESYWNITNILLGLALVFLSRISGCYYLMNNINYKEIYYRCRKMVIVNSIPFLVCFIAFIVIIFLGEGYSVNDKTGLVFMQEHKYLLNMIELPYIGIMFLLGVLIVVYSILKTIFSKTAKSMFWFNSIGVLLTVLSLFLCVGFNNTSYYPSCTDLQSSLTIANSSSSLFTLKVMSVVSLLIPVILIYGTIAWRAMDKSKITASEFDESHN